TEHKGTKVPAFGSLEGLKPGHLALAVGRSPETGPSANLGIISAVSQGVWSTWRGGRLDRFVRLDMGLHPGSSGGAVVDSTGQVLGIATTALSRTAPLLVPTSNIEAIVREVVAHGRVARGYLGVGLQAVHLKQPAGSGLVILSVEDDSPAAKAGLGPGDILTATNDTKLTDAAILMAQLGPGSAGKTLRISLLRGGVPTSV